MSAALKTFLRKSPHPVAIDVDGKRVDVPQNGRWLKEVIGTIKALNGCKILALGADGAVLRAFELQDAEDRPTSATGDEEGDTSIITFARLIADAHDKGGKNAEPLLRAAMEFVTHQKDQLLTQGREIERLRAANTRMQAEILRLTSLPQGDGEGEPDLITAVLTGLAQAQAQKAGLPAPVNGASPRRDPSHTVKDPPGGKQPRKAES